MSGITTAPVRSTPYHNHFCGAWHPDAKEAEDAVVFHWHWLPPWETSIRFLPRKGRAIHAHAADWLTSGWDDAPRIAAEAPPRVVAADETATDFESIFLSIPRTSDHCPDADGNAFMVGPRLHRKLPRPALPILLQRWTC